MKNNVHNMKEYTVTLKFTIESQDADYEKINEFAEKLSENIMDYEALIVDDDVEVTMIEVDSIEDFNDDGDYYEDEEEDF